LSGHKSPGADQIPEELIQPGDGKTLRSKISKPINVISSNKELQNSSSCQPCFLFIGRVQQFSRHINFVNCVPNSIQHPAVKFNFIRRQHYVDRQYGLRINQSSLASILRLSDTSDTGNTTGQYISY